MPWLTRLFLDDPRTFPDQQAGVGQRADHIQLGGVKEVFTRAVGLELTLGGFKQRVMSTVYREPSVWTAHT